MKIEIVKTSPTAITPQRGSVGAAGYDLYANIDCDTDKEPVVVYPNETVKIGTGIKAKIPNGYFGAVFARSGLATKNGLRPANCVGVIDSDYRGEIIVAIHNDSCEIQTIHNADRIAQLVIIPYLSAEFKEVDTLDDTIRGTGGFGSTDVKLTPMDYDL